MPGDQRSGDESLKALAQTIEALGKRAGQAPGEAFSDRTPAASPSMSLPPGLAEEAAKIVFEFWERNAAYEQGLKPIPWEDLLPRYQVMWLEIVRVILELAFTVMLTDIHRFFEQSNGDMGAAFARALRRFAAEQLNTRVNP